MRDGTILPMIVVPLVAVKALALVPQSLDDEGVVSLPLAAPNDLAEALRRQQIAVLVCSRILGILLHVEWLELFRIIDHAHWDFSIDRQKWFLHRSEIASPGKVMSLLLKELHSLLVLHAVEGRLYLLQCGRGVAGES